MREVPCSGKTDGQYLLHALEGGGRGLCVVACPKGECHLAQGNYGPRSEFAPSRGCWPRLDWSRNGPNWCTASAEDSPEELEQLVRGAVERICALGESPLRAAR